MFKAKDLSTERQLNESQLLPARQKRVRRKIWELEVAHLPLAHKPDKPQAVAPANQK